MVNKNESYLLSLNRRLFSQTLVIIMLLLFMMSSSYLSGDTTTNSQTTVDLGSAASFVILAKAGISTTGNTSIVGDIGVSPISSTAITGFGLIKSADNTSSTSSLVNGKVYAADYAAPTPGMLSTAVLDMEAAFDEAKNRTNADFTELGTGALGGLTLAPGLYNWSTTVSATSDFTISGNSTDIWVFQIAQTFVLSSGVHVMLSGGAVADNIFWIVSEQVTIGTTAVLNGNVLGKTAIVFETGSTLNGRALAQTEVTLDATTIIHPNATPVTSTTETSTTETSTTETSTTETSTTETSTTETSTPVSSTAESTTLGTTQTDPTTDPSFVPLNFWFSILGVVTISIVIVRLKNKNTLSAN
jgi:hypothetical protein